MKNILIVEDNPADSHLIDLAFSESPIPTLRSFVQDGVEAMAFLRREGFYCDAPRPDLILLDLNLPKKNGHEVLDELRADSDLCQIPLVVISGSSADIAMVRRENEGAGYFLVKPTDLDAYFARFHALLTILGERRDPSAVNGL
ncbi:MAG: response regulator [Methanobacteriota archaeon]|nr:MAG: response regulator [Euryarchaeota archaeon]